MREADDSPALRPRGIGAQPHPEAPPGDVPSDPGASGHAPPAGGSGAAAGGDAAGAGGEGGETGQSGAGGGAGAGEGGDAGSDAGPALPTSEWRMMGYDLASTYFNSAEQRLTKENARQLDVAWTADMGGPVYGAPLQVGDAIYASSVERITAFEAATGAVRWSQPIPSLGSLAYEDGTLYLLAASSDVMALDAESGAELWSTPLDPQQADGANSSVTIVGDLVVVGGAASGDEPARIGFRGFLAAFQRTSGALAWRTYTVPEIASGAGIWSSPSADLQAQRIYATTGNNYALPDTDTSDAFLAFDLDGRILWKNQRRAEERGFPVTSEPPRPLGAPVDLDFGANPVLYEAVVGGVRTELVAAGSKSGTAHALRRSDGMQIWSHSLGMGSDLGTHGIFSNSTWTGKYMLFALNNDPNAVLYALDGATGDIAWTLLLALGKVWGRTAVANGVGCVGAGEQLVVFDADTGQVLKAFSTEATVAGTITIANGRIAFGQGLGWADGVYGDTLTVLAVP